MAAKQQHHRSRDDLVAEAAALWGVSLTYRDATGRLRESPRDAIMEVLGSLIAGAPAGRRLGTGPEGQHGAVDHKWLYEVSMAHRVEVRDRLVEPVLVAWDGRMRLEIPPDTKATLLSEQSHEERSGPGVWVQTLPFGYHRVQLENSKRIDEAKVISAPRRCWQGEAGARQWGLFAPTYALRSTRDWGAGDLAEIRTTLETVADVGGSAVSTLPLLASFLDRPFEPSPYRPVSRLFWNEIYLAVESVPEWSVCGSARAVWQATDTQQRVTELRSQDLVDYAGVMTLKRKVVEELSRYFFQTAGDGRRAALEAFVCERPEVLDYAEFRAKIEEFGCDWRNWPQDAEVNISIPGRVEELSEAARYHVYCQWQMEEQLRGLSGCNASNRQNALHSPAAGLFLDVPVGIHPGGFDAWKRQDLFVGNVSIGSPPDAFFSHGQSWDSPPIHPLVARSDGHSYWSEVLRNHMRFATRLRIDHVMSLDRLLWIPEGRKPSEGVYVHYPAEEMYAVLCLESHRHRTRVTGEDLGTVPPEVRPRMRRHGVSNTWVLQGSLRPRAKHPIGAIPEHVVAALGTHDMFPLAGFLAGKDIVMRIRTGQMDEEAARSAFAARRRLVSRLCSFMAGTADPQDPASILRAVIRYLARSRAEFVLVNLDDLLLQREAHNVPGTGSGFDNWRRKLEGERARIERVIHEAADWLDRGRPAPA